MACRSLPAAFNILQLSLCLGTEGGCISIVDLCVEIWTLELCRRGVLSELHGFRFGALKYFFFWLWCVCGYEHVLRGTQQEFIEGDCRAVYLLKLNVDVCDLK